MDRRRLIWRRKMLKLVLLLVLLPRHYSTKRWHVHSIFEQRRAQGDYHNLLQEMRLTDVDKFFNYMRMTPVMFDELLRKVGPRLMKSSHTREALSPGHRLSLTLRYLATGDSIRTMSFAYRVGDTTAGNIIRETCTALWNVLKGDVFMQPSVDNWKKVSEGFFRQWNFPNCVGAIDGKHVTMQALTNSGSAYYNYKGSHSLILLAVCDSNYVFTIVDIGASGRQSDGGVFSNSAFGKALRNERLHLPEPAVLPGTNLMSPYCFVADAAFPLAMFNMRPYPGDRTGLEVPKAIFNYRLSRARRVIENAFGILAARWRIFRRPILGKRDTIVGIIQATVCLHNWVQTHELKPSSRNRRYCPPGFVDVEDHNGRMIPGRWRNETLGLASVTRVGGNNAPRSAIEMRDQLKAYFMDIGAVEWQWNQIGVNEED